jgi:hypothetical protein
MGIGRLLTWGFSAMLILIPFNWIKLWLTNDLPESSSASDLFLWAGGLWALGGGLAYFLIVSARGLKSLNEKSSSALLAPNRAAEQCSLKIVYLDANDQKTTRDIHPCRTGATNRKFYAWCALRQERRTFLFEGIQSGVDLTTGEILSRVDIFRKIHPTRKVPFI